MPRVYLTRAQQAAARWKKEDEEILGKIGAWLAVSGRNIGQLAGMAGMTERTLYNRMAQPGTLRLDEYRRIMEIIG